jgi:hypothetical protein
MPVSIIASNTDSPTVIHTMHPTSKLPLAITLLMAAVSACGSLASAQQAAPAATPFDKGVKINVVASKPARIKGGDWDDKMQRIVLSLKFTNTDLKQTYEGYTATISVLGQCVLDSKVKKVLLQEQAALSLPPRKTQDHVCEEVTTRFDKTDAKFGYFYDGWIIVVKDAAGKIVQVKSTSTPMEKLTELAAKIQVRGCYNNKLKPVADPDSSSD